MGVSKQKNKIDISTMGQWALFRMRFCRHRLAVSSLFVLFYLYLLAVFAEFFAPHATSWSDTRYAYAPPQIPKISISDGIYFNPVVQYRDPETLHLYYTVDTSRRVQLGFFEKGEDYRLFGLIPGSVKFLTVKPGQEFDAPWYFLGSDRLGRDVYSRLIHGARISLSIGLISIAITFVIGLVVGGISGYCGGRVDVVLQRVIEIINSMPQLPLWLAIGAIMPANWSSLEVYFMITVVLSFLSWTSLARVVRGKVLTLREEDYAVAARLLGATHRRILFIHLIPGMTSHTIVVLTLTIPGMILGETTLSFLRLGLRPPVVSWGVMLQDCMNLGVIADYPWLLMPVFAIILTVLSFNFLGDGMRDAADPYGRAN